MPALHHREIGLQDWESFIEGLEEIPSPRGSDVPFAKALKDWFGEDQAEKLWRLARRVRWMRARHAPRGNVVLVHGTMCSNLTTTHPGGFEDMLWLNLLRLALGRLDLLKLSPDGTADADPSLPIHVEGILKYTYAITLLWLRARWNVRPYAYDWRKDLDYAADGLADFIRARYPDEPVHLLAHSMGGLVCRNFIRRHPDLWASMADPALERGGRLLQLGSPNYGSYLASQALAGEGALVWALNSADLHHDIGELLEITNTFVAHYQLLPAPDRLPPEAQALYQRESWGRLPVSEQHLERARTFHETLPGPDTMDPARMLYIAGYGYRTPSALTIVRPGVFRHDFTVAGDGVTTLELGPLPGVPTWYLFANHFTMPAMPRVLLAVDDLLYRGRTLWLAGRPLPGLLCDGPLSRLVHGLIDKRLEHQLRDTARRASTATASAREVHAAERVLLARALGDRRSLRQLLTLDRAKMRL